MINHIKIPHEFVELCSEYYSGMNKLYAIASTGGLTTGNRKPYNRDEGRFMTDEEWYLHLWEELRADMRPIEEMTKEGFHSERKQVQRFVDYIDATITQLRTAYGLD